MFYNNQKYTIKKGYSMNNKISFEELETVTKKMIIERLSKLFNEDSSSNKNVEDIFEDLLEIVVNALRNKKSVMLKNVGTFAVNHKSARGGVRNPKTGEEMVLAERYTVTLKNTFKTGNKLITSEIIEALALKHPYLNIVFIKTCVLGFTEILNEVSCGEKRIEIRGFGVFSPRVRKAKQLRNPKTGESVWVDEKVKIAFKVSKKLLSEMNVA